MNIYEYNSNSINYYTVSDYGTIAAVADTTVDNGSISFVDTTDLILDSDLIVTGDYIVETPENTTNISYGEIVYTQTVYPFGSFKVNSNTNAARSVIFIAATEPLRLSSLSTTAKRSAWVGTGTLFEIGGGQELTAFSWLASSGPLRVSGSAGSKAIYSYSNASYEAFDAINYGLVSNASTINKTYGTVSDLTGGDSVDYGYVNITDNTYSFGAFSTTGTANILYKPIFGQIGSGSLFAIGGEANSLLKIGSSEPILFKIKGSASQAFADSYTGSGYLFSKSLTSEKVIYNYNTSSVDEFSQTDYGFITASGTTVNYGVITQQSSVEFDYGFVYNTVTTLPYGNISITGVSANEYKPSFAQTTTGSLFAVGGSATTRLFANLDSIALFKISGGEGDKLVRRFIGSGVINNISTTKENIVYDYNESSIENYNQTDYGFITASGTTVNYGVITQQSSVEFDYGDIWTIQTTYPFGVFNFSGGSVDEYKPSFAQTTTGSLFAVGGSATTRLFANLESVALFKIGGGEGDKFIRNYNASGRLLNINSADESITYIYSESSIVGYNEIDYGSITVSGTTTDYGYIYDEVSGVYNYGYIWNTDVTYPYGTLHISGDVSETFKRGGYRASGSLFATGGVATTSLYANLDSTVLFTAYGTSPSSLVKLHIGAGYISNIGSTTENATYDYNESSIETYNEIDYGLITESGTSVNYGSVVITSSEEFNYGYVFNSTTTYPFGGLKFAGSSTVDYKPIFGQIGSGSLFAVGGAATTALFANLESIALFEVSGSAQSSLIKPYIGSGVINNVSNTAESITYIYNENCVVAYDQINYGFITESGVTTNYGSISNDIGDGIFDYGHIWNIDYSYPFGVLNVSGSVSASKVDKFAGSGSLFAVGSTTYAEVNTQESTVLFRTSGTSATSFIRSHSGSGSLSNIGSKIERATYHYNESSIEVYNIDVDYGFITESGASVDYGSVGIQSSEEFDYGYLFTNATTYPFGSFNVSGVATVDYKPIFAQFGAGSLFAVGGSADTRLFANLDSIALFRVSGNTQYSLIKSYIGSGVINNVSNTAESVTYIYDQNSVVGYEQIDLGSITESGTSANYGSISSDIDSGITDYGYIWNIDFAYPFGTLNASGSASASKVSQFIGSGSLFAVGSTTYTEVNTQESTVLFRTSGASATSFIRSHSGSGSLINIGFNEERATFNYNESSIEEYNIDIDYGFITDSGTSVDYGSIVDSSYEEFDYGYVFQTATEYPFGSINISGVVKEVYKPIFAQRGSGSLFAIGGAAFTRPFSYSEPTGLFKVYGSAITTIPRYYTATGSLFSVGSKDEKATFSYNSSSIEYFDTIDYGYITSSGLTINYGDVSSIAQSEVDYGTTEVLVTSYPYGTFELSGAVKYGVETGYIPVITGRGSLFAIGGESNAYSRTATTETQLFRVYGSSAPSRTRPFIASGSLFTFRSLTESKAVNPPATGLFRFSGSAIEKNTESYVGSGSITLQTAIYPEYLYYRPTPRYVTTSGDVFISGTSEYRYFAVHTHVGSGTEFISGSAIEKNTESYSGFGREFVYGTLTEKRTRTHVGSGSLFTIVSATESTASNPPEETVLFRFSGSATEKNTESYVGFIPAEVSGTSQSSATSTFIAQIDISVSGLATEKSTVVEIGSGSLFTFVSATESTTVNPTEETATFTISGQASTRFFTVYTYEGAGSEFVGGFAQETKTDSFSGSGTLFAFAGSAEVFAANPPEETVVINISGSASQAFNRVFVASGTEFISGSLDESTTQTYAGFGSLFAINGAAESSTYSTRTETVLFNVSGNATVDATRSYVGSGTEFVSGSAQVPAAFSYLAQGTEFISGASETVSRTSYNGSGSLFTFNGSSESRTIASETAGTFNISGSGYVLFIRSAYNGTGSLFAVGGSAESTTINPTEETPTIVVSGSATTTASFAHAGSGSEYIYGQLTQAVASKFNGSGSLFAVGGSAESAVSNPPEETVTIKISGAATGIQRSSAEAGSGTFTYQGNLSERKTNSFSGSGSLFTVLSTSTVKAISAGVETSLFRISGSGSSSFIKISVLEGGKINISGQSVDYPIISAPPRIFGTII